MRAPHKLFLHTGRPQHFYTEQTLCLRSIDAHSEVSHEDAFTTGVCVRACGVCACGVCVCGACTCGVCACVCYFGHFSISRPLNNVSEAGLCCRVTEPEPVAQTLCLKNTKTMRVLLNSSNVSPVVGT